MRYSKRLHYPLPRDSQGVGGVCLWLVFRCLPGLVLGSLLLLLVWNTPARAALANDSTLDALSGIESGQMLLRADSGGGFRPAIIQSSKVHFDISGMLATVQVEQTFRNDTDRWLEGVYAFPLPDDAAVRSLEMIIGERRIVGKVREKAVAEKIYQRAKQAGKKASLVQQQRPNLFTNRVANVGPGEVVTVRLEYVQQVAFKAKTFSLRFPTTITARYMPGRVLVPDGELLAEEVLTIHPAVGWAKPTVQVPDASSVSPYQHPTPGSDQSPLNRIEITASLDMGMPLASVTSPYHEIALARRAGIYDIRLASGHSEMNRDFVLSWQPVTGASPAAALFTERRGEEYFGLLMVVPPATAIAVKPMPREVIFVVDTSGSMGGVSIEQARSSLSLALTRLQPHDRFNIIEFNTSYRAMSRRPMPATRHHVQRAQEFVRHLVASGGTVMLPALQAALSPAANDEADTQAAMLRQVIFITDGAVANEVALFEEIAARIGDSRLFTVGIGSAPNSWFMRKAAEFGRGSHTHIGDLNEVGPKMAALFEQLSQPAAVDLGVDWPGSVEAWPERLPDLYLGQPIALAVSFGSSPPVGEVRVSARINGKLWNKRLAIDTGTDPVFVARHGGVASLWARRKIAGLLDQKIKGRAEQDVRSDVLAVALAHQVLSPYTSFIAVEEVIARPAADGVTTRSVPNSRPQGQAPQHFAYPRTATTGPAKVWIGILLLFLAIIVRVIREPEVDHEPALRD